MNELQAMIDGMAQHNQRERAQDQMTLGDMIERLEEMDPEVMVGLEEGGHSYRGYYIDFAFGSGSTKVHKLLQSCNDAMGEVFGGYKGGDYVMGKLTPVWVAGYGDCGSKLMGINDDGTVATKEDDD